MRFWAGPVPVLLVVLAGGVVGALAGDLTDLSVYRYAGQAVLEGRSVYAGDDPVTGLPFTYPPVAALLLAPWGPLPAPWAAGLWTAVSMGALAVAIVVVRAAQGRPGAGWPVALLVVGALALEPVWQNLAFGQVNLLLMAMVLIDLLRPPGRWSGILIGIAAAVKLTPLVFIVLLVLVGRRAAAGRALLTFVVGIAVGLLLPGAGGYWTDGLLRATRVGPPALAHNQSLYGALTRLLDGPPSTALWLVVAGPVAALVMVVAVAWWRRGDPPLAAGLAALAMLLASPVSWSHHWVWSVPVALALWRRSRLGAGLWIAVFVARPMLWPPWGSGREYEWGAGEQLLGNAYVLAALAVVLWAAVRLRRQPRSARTPWPRVARSTGDHRGS